MFVAPALVTELVEVLCQGVEKVQLSALQAQNPFWGKCYLQRKKPTLRTGSN